MSIREILKNNNDLLKNIITEALHIEISKSELKLLAHREKKYTDRHIFHLEEQQENINCIIAKAECLIEFNKEIDNRLQETFIAMERIILLREGGEGGILQDSECKRILWLISRY